MTKAEITAPFLKRLRVSTEIDDEDEHAINSLSIAIRQVVNGEAKRVHRGSPIRCCLVIEGLCYDRRLSAPGSVRSWHSTSRVTFPTYRVFFFKSFVSDSHVPSTWTRPWRSKLRR
ncbi:hypothetical protein [Bradyrhizobium sp. I1.7.5]|uniref:hypothetical protein n=1 Tax=Bradyrhizobium sp. I1.7.5 TaxID=3156363 RepID=UPI0033907CAE